MLDQLSRNWWLFVLRGIVAIVFGLLSLIWPQISFSFLVLLLGAFAFTDGILAVIEGIFSRTTSHRWWAILEGLIGITIGGLTFIWPREAALSLLYFVAAWAMLTGLIEIIMGVEIHHVTTSGWFVIGIGLASFLLGILVMRFPGAGALGLVGVIAAYALGSGMLFIAFGIRVRGFLRHQAPETAY